MTEFTKMVTPSQGKTATALELAKTSTCGSGFVLCATTASALIERTPLDPSNAAFNCALVASFATSVVAASTYAALRFSNPSASGSRPNTLARAFGFAAGVLLPLGITAGITSAPAQSAPVAYVVAQDPQQDTEQQRPLRDLMCHMAPTRPECDFHPFREM